MVGVGVGVGAGAGAGRRGSRAPRGRWTAWRTRSENDLHVKQSIDHALNSPPQGMLPPAPRSRTCVSTGRMHVLRAFSLPTQSIPLQMTRHQQDGPRYRISSTTCPFLRLPAHADPGSAGKHTRLGVMPSHLQHIYTKLLEYWGVIFERSAICGYKN
jgi:hypothetical protein